MDLEGGVEVVFHKENDQKKVVLLLMEGRNPANQLRLLVFLIVERVFIHPRCCRIASINNSTGISLDDLWN